MFYQAASINLTLVFQGWSASGIGNGELAEIGQELYQVGQ